MVKPAHLSSYLASQKLDLQTYARKLSIRLFLEDVVDETTQVEISSTRGLSQVPNFISPLTVCKDRLHH